MRERLAKAMAEGIVTPTGMIAHGRGEAYDYLLGEATIPSADKAERVAACSLIEAANPVICVNGNAAIVAGKEIIELAETIPAKIEVNLFHRSQNRIEKVIRYMESLGEVDVLGRKADARIDGIASERSMCTQEGIASADVILVPIEDGDRAKALVDMGKTVIAVDLNPLSRTSKYATISIVDEASRAIKNIASHVTILKDKPAERIKVCEGFDNNRSLMEAINHITNELSKSFE